MSDQKAADKAARKDDLPPFIPPAPVKPGFDRDKVVVVSDREFWGYNARPSRMKTPLPEGWRPSRALSPREEKRLEAMRLWVKARGVEMADWEAFFAEWLTKSPPNEPLPGTKGEMGNALRRLDAYIARTDGANNGEQIGAPIAGRLSQPDSTRP